MPGSKKGRRGGRMTIKHLGPKTYADAKREKKYDAMKDRMRRRLEEKERKIRKNKIQG